MPGSGQFLPEGTVTVMCTDLVGSTSLNQRFGDAHDVEPARQWGIAERPFGRARAIRPEVRRTFCARSDLQRCRRAPIKLPAVTLSSIYDYYSHERVVSCARFN